MKQLMVIKDGVAYASNGAASTIAGVAEITSLEEGALAMFGEDGVLIAANAQAIAGNSIFFATMKNGIPLISNRYYKPTRFVKTTYVAPAARVMVVGSNTDAGTTYNLNLPAAPVAGTTAELMVIDLDRPFDDKRREKIYEYVVKKGDTAATIAAGIIAKINADPKRIVNAAEVDVTNHDGFKLTGITAGHQFNVVCGGILINADVLAYRNVVKAGTAGVTPGYLVGLTDVVVTGTTGKGTSAKISALEYEVSPMEGNGPLAKENQNLYNNPSVVVAGQTYVTNVLSSETPNDNVLIKKQNMTYELTIAIPAASYGVGETGTVFDALMALWNA